VIEDGYVRCLVVTVVAAAAVVTRIADEVLVNLLKGQGLVL